MMQGEIRTRARQWYQQRRERSKTTPRNFLQHRWHWCRLRRLKVVLEDGAGHEPVTCDASCESCREYLVRTVEGGESED
jgi:hypothetical protein